MSEGASLAVLEKASVISFLFDITEAGILWTGSVHIWLSLAQSVLLLNLLFAEEQWLSMGLCLLEEKEAHMAADKYTQNYFMRSKP